MERGEMTPWSSLGFTDSGQNEHSQSLHNEEKFSFGEIPNILAKKSLSPAPAPAERAGEAAAPEY